MSKSTYSTEIEHDIAAAVQNFESMLREQVARNERMRSERAAEPMSTEFSGNYKAKQIIIGTAGGDGIGPIIMREVEAVLNTLLRDRLAGGEVALRPIGGFTLENRLAAGKTVPDNIMAAMQECDVLLKGPTTTPNAAMNAANIESANVYLRKAFDLFANVRPVVIPEEGIDWTFFRENTEGEYALGSRGAYIRGEFAVDFKVTTDEGTRRIARAAYEYARANGKKRVSIITKANIMKKTDGNFLNICREVAEDYPEIETDSWFIDIMAANLVNEDIRSDFEVFVLPNLYGDIITDEAAQIQGGVGTAGSANIGRNYAIFEAIHGSAPRMIEEGLGEYANPASLLKAASMMLSHVGYAAESGKLETALAAADEKLGARMTGLAGGATCREYANEVMSRL
ncbi:isocitrate/isopropylmalate family dehydrogenase [Mogibacterium sp. CM50]|uniref:isocitrate/isopropylmalate family dehydrogenase n=1 Tax=Mogibacterium sp. CM50 TaxID=936375 RepID=UPI00027C5225|nr:isocitrate/isopropylmalate family dehydrogenase [Mogibacterium sp. CM50]EJU23109.1 dehydrogenase, isocitrate/isopropylmalate family [Mogibacterium sp. CM50]